MTSEKYEVFKATGEQLKPGTFFVIRDQDVFGSAVLYAYVHTILTFLETLDIVFPMAGGDADLKARLRQLSDDVTKIADKWTASGVRRKFPT